MSPDQEKVTVPPGAMLTFAGLQKKFTVPLTPTEADDGLPVAGFVVGVGVGTACVGAGVLPAGMFVGADDGAVGLGSGVAAPGAVAVALGVAGDEIGVSPEPGAVVELAAWVATETTVSGVLEPEPPHAAKVATASPAIERAVSRRIVVPR